MRVTLLCSAAMLGGSTVAAQVLARPGWAGSGVTPEPWWRSAVFYRLDPARFQDSDGDGAGDLPGVALRLDYLQSLGVDAILLGRVPGVPSSAGAPTGGESGGGDAGLDDLVRAASNYHLRSLVTVSPELQNGDRTVLLGIVHHWLSLGVAGVWLPKPPLSPGTDVAAAETRYLAVWEALRGVLRATPGERLLLADPVTGRDSPETHNRTAAKGQSPVMLTTAAVLPAEPPDAVALRSSLASLSGIDAQGDVPLLRFAGRPRTGSPDAVAEAALLLGSRGAVILDFGDEIGLNTSATLSPAGSGALPLMQWTPGNVQRPAALPIETPAAGSAASGPVYGAYRPYIHPPPTGLTGPAPSPPRVAVDGDIPAAPPAPDTLPGFTGGKLPVQPTQGERVNVAGEERDPHSDLAAFRQLIALHHGNVAMRSGAEVLLPASEASTVVWLRRKPAASATASDVLCAVNLGDREVTLQLDEALAKAGMHPGRLRALFTYAAAPLTGESTDLLRLPPHSVYIGEPLRQSARR